MATTPDPRYIPAFNIEDVLLDKDTGAPLSGGLVYFERNSQPGILKSVYQLTETSMDFQFTPLPNPMTLSSIGTFVDALGNPVIPYFLPYDGENIDLYNVRVTSSGDVPQFERIGVPYVNQANENEIKSVITNEISNPQFAVVNFDTTGASYTYSVNAVTNQKIQIAPGWFLIVSATAAGSVTLKQLTPTGSLNIVTNPGTILNITSAGLSKLQLVQRIYGSPNLWGNGFISASFVAKTYAGTPTTLTLYYSQSNGLVVNKPIVSASLLTSGDYDEFPGVASIPISTSSDESPDAYIDIYFDIPLSTEIDITSVMLSFTGDNAIEDLRYDQETKDRQIDHLFHYYQPYLNFKPINSYLVGWDFPLNPAQWGDNQTVTPVNAKYIWDQTIMCSATGNVDITRFNTLTATTNVDNEAFYLLQYLQGAEAIETVLSTLSVNVSAYSLVNPGVVVKVYLFYGNTASLIPATATSLGTINAAGEFSLTAINWGAIGQPDGNANSATILQSVLADYPFIGFTTQGLAFSAGVKNFAIVITFKVPTAGTQVLIPSISCVPGNIATRPAPLTASQVLSQCQYYWRKSFLPSQIPAQNVGANSGESYGVQARAASTTTGPIIRFEPMRATPIVTLYNPIAANGEIANITGAASWSGSTATNITQNGFYTTGTGNLGSAAGDTCGIHWTANARLGDV